MISVVVPTYNQAHFLPDCINSVFRQTYDDYEIIVVDDGSTDNTREEMKPYSGRARYIYKANGGVASARNVGIHEANGDYIAFLDSDDLWHPEKLKSTAAFIDTLPHCGLFHSNTNLIRENGSMISMLKRRDLGRAAYHELLMGYSLVNSSITVKKECFTQCGVFYEQFKAKAGAEDWDMWIRICRKFPSKLINEALVYYRIHQGNYSKNEFLNLNEDILSVLHRAIERDRRLPAVVKQKAFSNAYYLRGRKYLRATLRVEARKELRKCLRINPFHLHAYLLYAASGLSKRLLRSIRRACKFS